MGLFDMMRVCPNCKQAVKTGMTGKCPNCKTTTILPNDPSDMSFNRTMAQWKSMTEAQKKEFVDHALSTIAPKDENYVFVLDNGADDVLKVFENYCTLSHKGGLNTAAMGGLKGEKRVNFQSISAIEFREADSSLGYIQFSIPGGVERQGGVFNAAKDENSIIFNRHFNAKAKQIVDYIESKRQEMSTPKAATVVQQASAADELKKFKELLDMVVISQEEFDAKKKQLLGL